MALRQNAESSVMMKLPSLILRPFVSIALIASIRVGLSQPSTNEAIAPLARNRSGRIAGVPNASEAQARAIIEMSIASMAFRDAVIAARRELIEISSRAGVDSVTLTGAIERLRQADLAFALAVAEQVQKFQASNERFRPEQIAAIASMSADALVALRPQGSP